ANPATTTTTTTTSVTDAQLEALIEHGVARALATHDADKNTNDDDSHNSGTGARRTKRVTRECTYPDFMKCKPLNFKGTKADNKRKSDDTTWNNHQQPNKRQNTRRAYAAGNGKRKEYGGTLPLCNKCKFYHNGQCTIKYANYKRVELKNHDHGNQAGGTGAHGMVHALEGRETNQDLNDIEDDINA
nr:hypothetical protein [Tanacetum cinerariifolium]